MSQCLRIFQFNSIILSLRTIQTLDFYSINFFILFKAFPLSMDSFAWAMPSSMLISLAILRAKPAFAKTTLVWAAVALLFRTLSKISADYSIVPPP